MLDTAARIPGYERVEWIGETAGSRAVRARRSGQSQPVLLKVIEDARASSSQMARFRREYEILRELDVPGVVKPISFLPRASLYAMVLEDSPGCSLESLLGRARLDVTTCLRIASRLTTALMGIHSANYVHHDIRPANLLVTPDGLNVCVLDCSLASPYEHETVAQSNLPSDDDRYPYMSPEQTGRMNREVDLRSDLYSLGVTLYEMLTGTLPFRAGDALEWVHCHIARVPPAPVEIDSDIPRPVSEIVMKLLEKVAEKRYQTAGGLRYDIDRCLKRFERGVNANATFALGSHDRSDQFSIPRKLYGRDLETATLLGAFERCAVSGRPELMLVEGYSGVGKTALVHELHKPIVNARGYFVSGKFDPLKGAIPYSALIQAFGELIKHVLTESDDALSARRESLLEALGGNAQLVIDVIPDVELLLGKQPAVAPLDAAETENRFLLVFQRFARAFTEGARPLAVFLDDLQWADAASLGLLEALLTDSESRHVFFIGAYRSNEVGTSHPLTEAFDRMTSAGAWIETIALSSLERGDVHLLLSETLRCDLDQSRELSELVVEKTHGNPFFVNQFLHALRDAELLAFDVQAAGWRWDLERIRSTAITDNVVELMAAKIQGLSDDEIETVKLAACVGSRFDLTTVAAISGESVAQTAADLWRAVRDGLVTALDDSFELARHGDFPDETRDVVCRFVHDDVREAAYSLIPESRRARLHLQIGRRLSATSSPDKLEDRLFEIANHFLVGGPLIHELRERSAIAQLFLRAGRKARATAAYEAAVRFLNAGTTLLESEGWVDEYRLAFDLMYETAECEWLGGHFTETERLLQILHSRSAGNVDKLAVYGIELRLSMIRGDLERAIQKGLDALRLVGVEASPHPSPEQVATAFEKVWNRLGDRAIEDLLELPPMEDEEMKAATSIAATLIDAAVVMDDSLYVLLACIIVDASLRFGNAGSSAAGYAHFGLVSWRGFGRYEEGYQFERLGHDLVRSPSFSAYTAKVCTIVGQSLGWWMKGYRTGIHYLEAASHAGAQTGDLLWASYSCSSLVTTLCLAGETLAEVEREADVRLEFVRNVQYEQVADMIATVRQFVRNLRGLTNSLSTFSDDNFDEAAFEEKLERSSAHSVCRYNIWKLQARVISGDFDSAVAAAARAEELRWTNHWKATLPELDYWKSLALAARFDFASPAERDLTIKTLEEAEHIFGLWATHCPDNFASKGALIAAERARIQHRDGDAMRLYEDAIRAAKQAGLVQNEAISYETAARFYKQRGADEVADTHVRHAIDCYRRWGADAKVEQLHERYPRLAEEPVAEPEGRTHAPELDLVAVTKASQAISGEMVVDRLLTTLMRVVTESAGAQRTFVLLERDEGMVLAAEASVEGQDVNVRIHPRPRLSDGRLPLAILNYVRHSHESVVLDDASVPNEFSGDEYMVVGRTKSVLCMPIIRGSELIGLLYLENNLVTNAFPPDRLAGLELLASQAAISLQNAALFAELQLENTDRRAAEKARLESETRLHTLASVSPVGIFRTDRDGSFVYVNQRWCEITGLTPLESWRDGWARHLHPQDRDRVIAGWRGAVASRALFRSEYRFQRSDGVTTWVLGQALPEAGSEGAVMGYVGTITDITERKQAEDELRVAEARSRTLVEQLRLVTYAVHLGEGVNVVYASPQIEDFLGYTVEEWLQDPDLYANLLYPEDRDRVLMATDKAHQQGQAYSGEYRLVRRDGTVVWVRDEAAAVLDDQGRPLYVQGFLLDITDQKEAQAERVRLEIELRQAQKMEAIGRLAGGVAHDFNNLLTAIGGYSEFLLAALPPDDDRHADAREIKKAVERGSGLTRQLLAFTRRQVVRTETLDLNEIVTDMDKLLRRLIGADVELVTLLASDLGSMEGDRSQIEQVIVNLILNARDATPPGGKLVIETANTTVSELDQHLSLGPGHYVTLSVRDTGVGMDEDVVARIFEPFFTTKEVGRGTGLGLSTVFGIVEQSGGTITVDSEPGSGTTFVIHLPRTAPAEELPKESLSVVAESAGGETVLLVEDEEVLRALAARTLREKGYEVVEARYASEALELWRQRADEIDLVVSDIVMPGMSGVELAERIVEASPQTPVMLMSGFVAADVDLLPGDGGFLEKPFTPSTLLRSVRSAIERARASRVHQRWTSDD